MRLLRPIVVLLTASLLLAATASAETRSGTIGPDLYYSQVAVTYDDVAGSITLSITWSPWYPKEFSLVLNDACSPRLRGTGTGVRLGFVKPGTLSATPGGGSEVMAPFTSVGDTITATVTSPTLRGLGVSCLQGTVATASIGTRDHGVVLTVVASDPPGTESAPVPAPEPAPTPAAPVPTVPTTVTYTTTGVRAAFEAFLTAEDGDDFTSSTNTWLGCPKRLINARARTAECIYRFGTRTAVTTGVVTLRGDKLKKAGRILHYNLRMRPCSGLDRVVNYDNKLLITGRRAFGNSGWCNVFGDQRKDLAYDYDSMVFYAFPGPLHEPGFRQDGWRDYPDLFAYHCHTKRKRISHGGVGYSVACANRLGDGYRYSFNARPM